MTRRIHFKKIIALKKKKKLKKRKREKINIFFFLKFLLLYAIVQFATTIDTCMRACVSVPAVDHGVKEEHNKP